jgi:hypothetical protein
MTDELQDDPLPKDVRERLESEYGGDDGVIIAIRASVGKTEKVFAFRLPTRGETKRYRQMAQKPGRDPGDEMEGLLLTTCVYPGATPEDAKKALSAFFDRYSMAVASFGIRFQQGAGLDFEALAVVK